MYLCLWNAVLYLFLDTIDSEEQPLAEEDYYNNCQTTSRNVIERSFGLMKSRFPRLREKLEMRDFDRMVRFIISVCRMHNFCISEDKERGNDLRLLGGA